MIVKLVTILDILLSGTIWLGILWKWKEKNFSLDSHCLLFSHIPVVVQSWSRPYLKKLRRHAFQSWKHNDRRTGEAHEVWWPEVTGFTLLIWKVLTEVLKKRHGNYIIIFEYFPKITNGFWLLTFSRQANHPLNDFSRTSWSSCVPNRMSLSSWGPRGWCTFGSSLVSSLTSTCAHPGGWCLSSSRPSFRFFFFNFNPYSSKPTTRGVQPRPSPS